jgi:ArsR family transcriptional regulator
LVKQRKSRLGWGYATTLKASEVFKVLGDSTRLRILDLLKHEGALPVKTIAEKVGISAAAVSQHLKALKYAGLVSSERQGYWVPYSVDEEALENCCGMLIDVCSCHGSGPTVRVHLSKSNDLGELRLTRQRLRRKLEEVEAKLSDLEREG